MLGLLLLLTATIYAQSLDFDFVWDDFLLILQTHYFKHIQYVPLYFSSDFAHLTSGRLPAVYFRPLFALSFLMDFSLWGNNPTGYHLTNVLLYLGGVWLVARVGRRLFADDRAALLAAALFALHPAHVEPVAFVSARPDVLAGLGVLLAVLGYHRFRHHPGGWRWVAFCGSLLGFGIGLLSKEIAISLPVILAWYEIVLRRHEVRAGGESPWRRLGPILPSLMLGLGFLVFRWEAIRQLTPAGLGAGVLWQRVPGALEVLARYTALAIWPFRMQPAYAQPRPDSLLQPWVLLGLAVVLVSAAALLRWWGRWPAGTFALGWFLLTLAPVADLVPFAPRAVNMADRYLFIPSLGICWLLALSVVSLRDLAAARSRRAAIVLSALVGGLLVGWTGSTLAYARVWQDNIALFSRMVQDFPHAAFSHNNLGLALLRIGRVQEAIQALETAVRVDPADASSQLSLARTYVEHGRAPEGFRIFNRLEPAMGQEKRYILLRAIAHMTVNEWETAQAGLSRGLQRFPELAEAHEALGVVLERQGKPEEAADAYRRAVKLRPDLVAAQVGLARLALQLGDPQGAESAARAAIRMDSTSPIPWRALALALEALGEAEGSRLAWRRVLDLDETPAGAAEAQRHISRVRPPVGAGPRQ